MVIKVCYIVPYSDERVLKNWFLRSNLEDEVIKLKISKEKSAPQLLNEILDDLKKKEWLIFCDEWVRLLEKPNSILESKNHKILYGVTGALIKEDGVIQTFDGRLGYPMVDGKFVDSLGQGCMILHADAIKKFDLMFDENFEDKYMVDFSLQCKIKGFNAAILALQCRYKERIIPVEKEEIFKEKLRKKYPDLLPIGLRSGILTNNPHEDLKALLTQREEWIRILIKEKGKLSSEVDDYKKTFGRYIDPKEAQKYDSVQHSEVQKKIYEDLETKLVWIFGTPRSGSTWLTHDILRKEKIRSLDETMLGAQLGAFIDSPSIHWNWMNGMYEGNFKRIIDDDRKDAFFSSNFEKDWKESLKFLILHRIGAQFGFNGYEHVIIKAPNESHASDLILKCVPKSKLIFLIRDGRDVIDSRQGKFHNPRRFFSRPETDEERKFRIAHFAKMWNLMIETTQRAYDKHNSNLRLMVKYEDLLTSPINEIKKIYDFLGYQLPEAKIKEIADVTSFENVPDELKGDDKNIRKAKPGNFRDYFNQKELEIVNEIMKDNLKKYGYEI